MDRRTFIRGAGAVAGFAAAGSIIRKDGGNAAMAQSDAGMIYRPLGKTGEKVSVIGLGGAHIGRAESEKEAIAIMREALEAGLNFFDNSWDYNDGRSEMWMGKALRDGYRKKAFVMTKIDGRTKKVAAKQIDESLKRLGVDHIDLMQFHEIIRLEDPDRIFAVEGAAEAMLAARTAGKIRYIGFTGHKDPFVHLRMLDIAAQHGITFDTVQMPLNVMDAHFRSFGSDVLPRLVREGIGVLAMKPLAGGHILETGTVTAMECLQYAMSLPVSVVITGMESRERLKQALEAVRTFRQLDATQMHELLAKVEKAARTGRYEPFKTTNMYDPTAKHPEWVE